MDFALVLFVLMLAVPALILIAMARHDISAARGSDERSRVQQQRAAVITRRRFDQRRRRVWSAIDAAYQHFCECEQLALLPVEASATPLVSAPSHAVSEESDDFSLAAIADAFDKFATPAAAPPAPSASPHRAAHAR